MPGLAVQRPPSRLSEVDAVLGGLRVIAVHRPAVPVVELRLLLPFADTNPRHPARAELLAATLLSGTATRDRTAIDTDLALVGGELSTSVTPEWLTISGTALASGLDALLDVLADALTAAAYRDNEVLRERDRLTERIKVASAQPGTIARRALLRDRYGDHPLARETPDVPQVVDVSPAEVAELHRVAVCASGAVLVLVGAIDPDQATAAVARALDGWSGKRPPADLPDLPVAKGGDLLLVPRAGAAQSRLAFHAPGVGLGDPRHPAVHLANLAFAGFFSSRLVRNIREEKGYTYFTRSYLEYALGGGALALEADTAGDTTAATVLEIRYELGRLSLVPLEGAELDTVRRYAIGSELTANASVCGLASRIAELAAAGLGTAWPTEHSARLADVTADEVTTAASEFFAPARWTGVVVGDDGLLGGLRGLSDVRLQ